MDLKERYWWNDMKADVVRFVAQCDVCQRVKAEHQKPAGLPQPLPIPVWKWEEIGMDFVNGLPKTLKGNDSISVIVDRLTKVAHFIPVRTKYSGDKLAQLYVDNIVKLHSVPSRIVSDRGTPFSSKFWKSLHEAMGTKLDFSSAYHPQTDGQTKRINQIIENMLRARVLTYAKDWEKSLTYTEFSYQASLGMSPFEALYGRKCRTPLMWSEVGERTCTWPPRRAHLLARAPRHAGPTYRLFLAPLLLYKKIVSRNAQLGTIHIFFRAQITESTSRLTCKKV